MIYNDIDDDNEDDDDDDDTNGDEHENVVGNKQLTHLKLQFRKLKGPTSSLYHMHHYFELLRCRKCHQYFILNEIHSASIIHSMTLVFCLFIYLQEMYTVGDLRGRQLRKRCSVLRQSR